jgi:hypothetical protein
LDFGRLTLLLARCSASSMATEKLIGIVAPNYLEHVRVPSEFSISFHGDDHEDCALCLKSF